MIDAILTRLTNWLEGLACKYFYCIKTRNLGSEKIEWMKDEAGIHNLCQSIYLIQLPYRKEQA